ncbi:MAG TPA: BON domain-containing protein [Acidobacteriota bacterium]|jgi:hypothetical protein
MSRRNVVVGTLLGAAAGLALGILLAPRTGRQTRDWIGQKARHGGKLLGRGGEFLRRRAEYERNRLRGIFYETRRKFSTPEYASDETVTQRVRTELGRNVKSRNVANLSVDTFNGVVTVKGTVVDSDQMKDVLDVIYAVRGVRDIVNELRLEQFV